jgi:head-tail adaptor
MASIVDVFDSLMNSTCTILQKGTGASEGYNQPSQQLTPVSGLANIPCRLSISRGGKEYKSDKEFSINHFRVFLRPQTQAITAHHWLQLTDQNGNTYALNILSVNDPSGMGHHLELECEQYLP